MIEPVTEPWIYRLAGPVMRRTRGELMAHLALYSIPEPNSGCLLWTGSCCGDGYPNMNVAPGVNDYAHRVAYVLAHGPIPAGQRVYRRCEVMCCIEETHLYADTVSENSKRVVAAGRLGGPTHVAKMLEVAARGEKHVRAKLTDDKVRAILADERLQRVIAAEFGLAQCTVSQIKSKRRWRHVL